MSENAVEFESFSAGYKILHWVSAVLIFSLLCMGMYMGLMEVEAGKYEVYALHKSLGILVLVLACVRVLVVIFKKRPKDSVAHKKWERVLARIVQGALYVSLVAMPVSGWVMSSAGGYSVSFFGIGLPSIVGKSEALFHAGHEAHEVITWVLLVAVALHVAGALKHYFLDRDETLQRMTWAGIKFVHVLLLCALVAGAYVSVGVSVWREKALEHSHED